MTIRGRGPISPIRPVVAQQPEPASGIAYDGAYPGQLPYIDQVNTRGDNIGATSMGYAEPDVNMCRYIDQTVGGTTGVANKQGYTSGGMAHYWNANHFTGRTKQFMTRDLAKDTGPVGRSNYTGQLQSGVLSQFVIPPSLEDIYRSFTGNNNE